MSVFRSALKQAAFVGGPAVESFERDFADFCRVPHAVGVANGTDALRFALIAAGVGRDDVVITVPNTFAATVEAILQAGACPEFVDVDARTHNMKVGELEKYFSLRCEVAGKDGQLVSRKTGKRIAAIIPVHLYGQMADMDPILGLAERYGLKVIEDACQAHGARYFSRKLGGWKAAGSMGTAAAFSFYPGKNLGACGEAGAVTTNDATVARNVRILRDHGQSRKYYHDVEGYNGRLDAIQAGFLSVKLKHLAAWNSQRRRVAESYGELFDVARIDHRIGTPFVPEWAEPVYHLYVIRCGRRNDLQAHLSANQIDTGIHYPIPLHLQAAFASLDYGPGDFPVAESAASEILSLPMYPQLRPEDQRRVVHAIAEFASDQVKPTEPQARAEEGRVAAEVPA